MILVPTVPYLLPWDALVSDRLLGGTASAEAVLMQATLFDGLHQYLRHSCLPLGHEFQEEEAWLLADDYDWPFSFLNLCTYFGIDPCSLRDAMLRLRRNIRKEV